MRGIWKEPEALCSDIMQTGQLLGVPSFVIIYLSADIWHVILRTSPMHILLQSRRRPPEIYCCLANNVPITQNHIYLLKVVFRKAQIV